MEHKSGITSNLFDNSEECSRDISRMIADLWETKKYSDFVITTSNGAQVEVHKFVLACHCPFFKEMLDSKLTEAHSNRTTIDMVPHDVLMPVLEYLYTSVIRINIDNVYDLTKASHYFSLEKLKNECEKLMIRTLHVDNAVYNYQQAAMYHLQDLKTEAHAFIVRCFTSIVKSEKFLQMDVSLLSEFLEDDQLNINDEAELFRAVIAWIKHDENGRKEHANVLLKLVRFSFCSPEFINDEVMASEYLKSKEMTEYLLHANMYARLQERKKTGDKVNYKWKTKRQGYFRDEALLMRLENGTVVSTSFRDPSAVKCRVTEIPGALEEGVQPVLGPHGIFAVLASPLIPSSPLVYALHPVRFNESDQVMSSLTVRTLLPIASMAAHNGYLFLWCVGKDRAHWVLHNIATGIDCGVTFSELVGCTNQCVIGYKHYFFRLHCSSKTAEACMVKVQVDGNIEIQGLPWDANLAERLACSKHMSMLVHENKIHICSDNDHIVYDPERDCVESRKLQAYGVLLTMEGRLICVTYDTAQEMYKMWKWMPVVQCWMPCGIIDRAIMGSEICQISKVEVTSAPLQPVVSEHYAFPSLTAITRASSISFVPSNASVEPSNVFIESENVLGPNMIGTSDFPVALHNCLPVAVTSTSSIVGSQHASGPSSSNTAGLSTTDIAGLSCSSATVAEPSVSLLVNAASITAPTPSLIDLYAHHILIQPSFHGLDNRQLAQEIAKSVAACSDLSVADSRVLNFAFVVFKRMIQLRK